MTTVYNSFHESNSNQCHLKNFISWVAIWKKAKEFCSFVASRGPTIMVGQIQVSSSESSNNEEEIEKQLSPKKADQLHKGCLRMVFTESVNKTSAIL
jgi:hypothetical protein